MADQRPNPDELLDRVQREETKARRGKLKIFFGASAGVGKTYTMLSAARQLRGQGLDVVVGIVETHGRTETMALLEGLEILPFKEIEYRGKTLREFDLEAALQRRPALILVDELAHTNAPGSRHPKRWQDVEELLAAGIDVFTTLNVQHLETLNDVVGSITGIRVWETVPDKVFDEADEVVLVDLTPDELLQRLHEGKIYIPQQAQTAIQNFFRKGNLLALRELALRRTAERVDDQMRNYRRERSIDTVWRTKESLLLCIGPNPGAEKLVRAVSRLAAQMEVDWHAVYVETPSLQRLPEAKRERILRILRMASDLGAAQTASLAGYDAAATVVDYALRHNISQIVVGRKPHSGWKRWQRSFAERVGQLAPELDIIQIAPRAAEEKSEQGVTSSWRERQTQESSWLSYWGAIAACGLAALFAALAFPFFDQANIVMVFLLAVVLVAFRYGRGPAIVSAFLSVLLFDFFFVPPLLSFAISDAQYLLTFAIMLGVALLIGYLTSNLRYQVRIASLREEVLRSLYEMARNLSASLVQEQIIDIAHKFGESMFSAKIALLLTDEHDKLQQNAEVEHSHLDFPIDFGVAQWCFDHIQAAGFGTDTLPGSPLLYLPLQAPMRTRGVLVIEPTNPRWLMVPEQRRQLDAFVALVATALERVHYIEVAQNAVVKMESERLRNSVLSVLSHDLRTPLTVLVGLADSLARSRPGLSGAQLEMAEAIRDQAFRMIALVNNLLDMARLQAGEVRLNRQWQQLEEVVGSAIKAMKQPLSRHHVQVELPDDLPLLEFDTVLIERVLCNLLENAAKYTPPGSNIHIGAQVQGMEVQISVSDNGPGLALGKEETIFEKFTRGEKESATPGVGLGLAVCRAIVEAHKGRIWAENVAGGGARFVFTLPLGTPPSLDNLPESENQTSLKGETP